MLVLIRIELSGADLTAFERYEAEVLPLLADHGGALERRLKGEGFEAHLVRFPSTEAFHAYLRDPRREEAQALWVQSGAHAERWEVTDLPV